MFDDDMIEMYHPRLQRVQQLAGARKVLIYIHPRLRAKMQYWIDKAEGEVGGLGRVAKVDNGGTQLIYVVQTVELVEQDAEAAQVQLDALKEIAWLDKNYPGWRESKDKPPLLFWHSHVNMASRFSGQDDHAIRSLTATGSVVLSVVGNKREEYDARCDFEVPIVGTQIEMAAEMRDQPLVWLTDEEKEQLDAEFDELVREEPRYGTAGYKGYKSDLEKQIEALEKVAEGTDKVAEVARRKLPILREELKGRRSHVSKTYGTPLPARRRMKADSNTSAADDAPDVCTKCGKDFEDWDSGLDDECFFCRTGNKRPKTGMN